MFQFIGEILVVFFFFSSRRRHTRSDRDWSSDVCSSDLTSRNDEQSGDTEWLEAIASTERMHQMISEIVRLLQDQQAGHRSEEHTSELQSRSDLVCRLLLEKKKKQPNINALMSGHDTCFN